MDMSALPVDLLLLPLLAIVALLCLSRAVSLRRCNAATAPLPPSPWALPVIGHLHHLAGALPHHAMRDLAARHGPLMLLRLGALPVVVASSAAAAREVMQARDLDFATRSMSRTIQLAFPRGTEGIIFAPYGDVWRQIRKVCTVELLSARRVRSFSAVREEEAARLLRAVAASSPPPAQAVNLGELMTACAADSAVRTIIGRSLKDRHAFLTLLERSVKMFGKMSLPDLFPSSRLAMLVSRMPGQMERKRAELATFADSIVREHEENKAAGEKEDFLDVLLRIQREGDLQVPITTDNVKSVVGDLLGTGSETVATMLQWIMAELMRHPRVMQKAQDEVRHVLTLAGQRQVTEEHLGSLHYIPLVIKEALRLHPPAPLLFPRECRSTCQVLGFTVPKGTMVLVNAWAISRDPKYWDMPEEFVPERFEHSMIDFKGIDFEYTPFGAGRRMCPGMAFALAGMELVLASLLYHFDWELPGGMQAADLDMTEEMGVTARRQQDLQLVPVVRVPLLEE